MDLIAGLERGIIILCVLSLLLILRTTCARDDYGDWHQTLRPQQAHACDNQELSLKCSNRTIISVHYVSYGSQIESAHICPGSTTAHPGECRSAKAVQMIRDRCHQQVECRFHVSPQSFKDDPCPGIRKYTEVMYKCRPQEFLNKIVCEDGLLTLLCPQGQALTIYSASFGTTQAGAAECRQPEGVQPRDCLIDQADQTVRSICTGRQNCSLRADVRTFGNPNCLGTKYLKVAYNCMDKQYLLPTARPSEDHIQTTSYPAWAFGVDQSSPSNFRSREYGPRAVTAPSDSSKLEMQSDEVPTNYKKESLSGNQELVGFMSKWASAQNYMTGNRDKLILYVSLSLGLGLMACATVLTARCLVHRLESRRPRLPSVVDAEEQFFSDSDLEDPPLPPPPPITSLYASIRRHSSDAAPRAPVSDPENDVYFS